MYERLSTPSPGLAGSLTARGPAHVTRLSLLYALLDRSKAIRIQHQQAALACWEYSVKSVAYIFGDSIGNPIARAIFIGLKDFYPGEMSRMEIMQGVFHGHKTAAEIEDGLVELEKERRAAKRLVPTAGRTKEVWKAVL